MVGKPSAIVTYRKSYGGMMTSQLVCGFLLDLIAAFTIAYVMWKCSDRFVGFGSRLTLALAFAAFTIFQSSLMMANWWGTPAHFLSGEITDHVIGWALGGAWLAWFFGRKQTA